MMALPSPIECPPRYQLWILVRKLCVGILTTRSARGLLTSRQINTCNSRQDAGAVLRYFVSVDSLWVRDIALDPKVSVVYADSLREQFLSVSGEARIKHCTATQTALWNSAAKRAFPGGPTDPMLRLLEVHIESAHLQNGPERFELTHADFTDPPRRVRSMAAHAAPLQLAH